ncbi:MAG: penicillin acylase family protein [Chloroflexi bacterium]|nr:penicillin acylase family protein [Chloroflexota bacterium]
MNLSPQAMLQRLGAGESIQTVCAASGMSQEEFDKWWQTEITSRVPENGGSKQPTRLGSGNLPTASVEIVRDTRGIPHIYAQNDPDLFFGLGYSMAQDRLWQLDYLRHKALGRLSEILGPEAVDQDVLVRTVGINRIATAEVTQLPGETLKLLDAFSQGINSVIAESGGRLPIEFSLLDYRPEPWQPLDSVAIWGEFRWYLTGRFPVIAFPELARRTVGDGPLFRAFLTPEAGEESILPRGSYPTKPAGVEKVGETVGDPDDGIGSNNWVVSGKRTATGLPMLASDPHIAFGTLSCWYECHLSGGSFNVTGSTYIGVPGLLFGRNRRVAWGITNNICSQRDLYQEKTDSAHPGAFLYDGRWEPARELTEEIKVKGGDTIRKTIRFSRNGPIVDEILPKPVRHTGPVSLRWLGTTFCDEITCILADNRANSADEFRAALRGWRVPTWSLVFADVDGHIGYQCVGRIPIRRNWTRGYRPGWDPEHQWQDLVPFEGMPALADPPQGWIRTANNRTAPEDYPYPLSGTWSSGHRAQRIRQMLEQNDHVSGSIPAASHVESVKGPAAAPEDFMRMHQDALSLRAVEALPPLLTLLANTADERIAQAAGYLAEWDGRMETDRVAASIFDVFFGRWCQLVAAERFKPEDVEAMAGVIGGLGLALLSEDKAGWFGQSSRETGVVTALNRALDYLEKRLGPDMSRWNYGRLHTITLRHFLSQRGDLGRLLNRGGYPVRGSGFTVCNTGYDANFDALSGANYRIIADLNATPAGLWAVDAAGESGHPGSSHYCDQLTDWLTGHYHYLPLDREAVEARSESKLILQP